MYLRQLNTKYELKKCRQHIYLQRCLWTPLWCEMIQRLWRLGVIKYHHGATMEHYSSFTLCTRLQYVLLLRFLYLQFRNFGLELMSQPRRVQDGFHLLECCCSRVFETKHVQSGHFLSCLCNCHNLCGQSKWLEKNITYFTTLPCDWLAARCTHLSQYADYVMYKALTAKAWKLSIGIWRDGRARFWKEIWEKQLMCNVESCGFLRDHMSKTPSLISFCLLQTHETIPAICMFTLLAQIFDTPPERSRWDSAFSSTRITPILQTLPPATTPHPPQGHMHIKAAILKSLLSLFWS